MKVRTVTAFVSLTGAFDESYVSAALEFLKAHSAILENEGNFEVQTTRLVFNDPSEWLLNVKVGEPVSLKNDVLNSLGALLDKHGVSFCSLGRLPSKYADVAPAMILANERFNVSVNVKKADVEGALRVAEACKNIAENTDGGLGNFRFCASSNFDNDSCCPFFPASFAPSVAHNATEQAVSFAIGLENGSDFQQACSQAATLKHLGREIAAVFSPALNEIERLCLRAEAETNASAYKIVYAGIDTSLNPALGNEGSIAYGFNRLKEVKKFGSEGASLAAVAEATTACQDGFKGIRLCGYCGCMLPLCEDEGLALSDLNARDLLSLSSTCGVGVDTLPLGLNDLDVDKLAFLYLDAAAVAFRKQRPLSVRVFPVPGLSSGQATTFDNPYLTNSKCRGLN
jgi:uncharacterized protein|eukprot:g467.t1